MFSGTGARMKGSVHGVEQAETGEKKLFIPPLGHGLWHDIHTDMPRVLGVIGPTGLSDYQENPVALDRGQDVPVSPRVSRQA